MINAKYEATRHVLVLTASNEGRAALAEAYERGGYSHAEQIVAEALHEAYEFFPPENVPGALTDSPILADCDDIGYPDTGDRILHDGAAVFWFPNYMIDDPFEELKNKGRVEFEEATPYVSETPRPAPYTKDFLLSHLPGGDREGCVIWIGDWSFPESWEYADVLAHYPFLCRSERYDPDSWDSGLYFWDQRGRHGPYNSGAEGSYKAESEGGIYREPEPEIDPRQMALPI